MVSLPVTLKTAGRMGRFIGMMTPSVSRKISLNAFIFQANSASDAAKIAVLMIFCPIFWKMPLSSAIFNSSFVSVRPSAAKNIGVRNSPWFSSASPIL